MCPLCLSAATWMALSGGSAASLAALFAAFRLKGDNNGDDRDDASERDA